MPFLLRGLAPSSPSESYTNIRKIFGYGAPVQTIISSAILALTSFFYIYSIGSFFRVNIYILHNRLSYNTYFDFFIINKHVDHIIIAIGIILWSALSLDGKARIFVPAIYGAVVLFALVSGITILLDIAAIMAIPTVICTLIYNKFASKKILNAYPNLFINYIAVIVIALSIIGILGSLEVIFSVPANVILPIPNYMYEIYLPLSSISPILVLLLVSCLPVKILMNEFMQTIGRIKKITFNSSAFYDHNIIRSRTKIICLILFMLLSIGLVLIPHQPVINTNNQHIGVDTHYYVDWVTALIRSGSPQEFLHQAFVIQSAGDRPITLIIIFTLSKIVPANLVDTIEYMPLILGPALIFVVYLLTREFTSNDLTSLFAAFLTAVSFQTLIGIYAGLYSNWFALIIGYLSFLFLLRFLKKSSGLSLVLYSVSIILLIFTHVYTWSVFLIATGIFLAVLLKLNYYNKRNILLLLLVLFASIILDIAKFTLTGSSSGIAQDMIIASRGGLGLEQFALRWTNLIDIVQNWYGVQFSNFIILMLGLFWLWKSNFRKKVNIFIVIFLSLGLATAFLGTPAVQGRILYDIPFQIAAALSLSYIKKQTGGAILIFAICVLLVSISIRAVLNFHF